MSRALFVVLALSVLALAPGPGCGGGGGSLGGGGLTGSFKFNAAASPGDLLTINLDFDAGTYSYQVVAGSQISPPTGSGPLTHLPNFGDRVYAIPGGTLIVLPNNLVLVELDSGEIIAGLPERSTNFTTNEIQGIYNYVSWDGSTFDYGTFGVGNGTYQVWSQANAAGPTYENGTWVDNGNGVLTATSTGGTPPVGSQHNVLIKPSSNGNLLVIDNVFEGSITLGVKQISFPSSVSATFNVLATDASCVYEVSASGANVTIPTDPCVSSGTANVTLQTNVPWQGFGFLNNGGDLDYVLISPDGLYFGGGTDGFFDWLWTAIAR